MFSRVYLLLAVGHFFVNRCAAEEESHQWAWAGAFDFPASGVYTWSAARKNGTYAEPSLKLVLVSAPNASSEGIESVEEEAEDLFNTSDSAWVQLNAGGEMTAGGAYVMNFDQNSWLTNFKLRVSAAGALVAFTEHPPAEFENGFHYLKSSAGSDVEAVAVESGDDHDHEHEEHHDDEHEDHDDHGHHDDDHEDHDDEAGHKAHSDKIWGEVVAGSLVTCLPPFLGLLLPLLKLSAQAQATFEACKAPLHSFASGVMFAAAVFLLLPEALHLAGAQQSETTGTWTWGVSILGGWLMCALIQHSCSLLFGGSHAQTETTTAEKVAERPWMSIAGPIIFGDFFHNLSDGLVLGMAFKSCGSSFAWKLVGVTLCHEIGQELADTFVLVTKAGMRWQTATLMNFMFSLSTLVGALVTYDTEVGANAHGIILAFGAGVYLFIAATELGPTVVELDSKSIQDVLQRILPCVVGFIVIGLVLLDHEHCDSDVATGDAHAGHAHL